MLFRDYAIHRYTESENKDANPTVRILTACLLVAEWLKE